MNHFLYSTSAYALFTIKQNTTFLRDILPDTTVGDSVILHVQESEPIPLLPTAGESKNPQAAPNNGGKIHIVTVHQIKHENDDWETRYTPYLFTTEADTKDLIQTFKFIRLVDINHYRRTHKRHFPQEGKLNKDLRF